MKSRKIISITSMLMLSILFVGCTRDNIDVNIVLEDASIEDTFEYPDNSGLEEFGEIADGNFSVNIEEGLSYESKTVDFGAGKVDVPSDWDELDLGGLKMYFFDEMKGNANILSESMYGLTSSEYMELAEQSVLSTLYTNDVESGFKSVNGVDVYTLEYIQEMEGQKVYTYQPTVFKDGKAYILTIGSLDESVVDNYKTIAEEIITTVR